MYIHIYICIRTCIYIHRCLYVTMYNQYLLTYIVTRNNFGCNSTTKFPTAITSLIMELAYNSRNSHQLVQTDCYILEFHVPSDASSSTAFFGSRSISLI